jgi:hypothetical protein
MLLIALAVLTLAWLLAVSVVVGLCVSAARGDRVLLGASTERQRPAPYGEGLRALALARVARRQRISTYG